MRKILLVAFGGAALLTVPLATVSQAQQGQLDPSLEYQRSYPPTWSDCYRLGWVRGVHVEQNELPAWMEQCLAGKIPFSSGPRPGRPNRSQ